jgi:hypothetical protein
MFQVVRVEHLSLPHSSDKCGVTPPRRRRSARPGCRPTTPVGSSNGSRDTFSAAGQRRRLQQREIFLGPSRSKRPQHRCTQRNWCNSSTRILDTVNGNAHHPAGELCSCAQCFVSHGERRRTVDHGSREGPVRRHAESECHWFIGSPRQWPWSFRTVPPPAAASAAASASSVVGPQRPK